MGVRDEVNQAIKAAMIAKDKLTLQTLRMVSAAFKQIEVDKRVEISDEIARRELVRLLKQRQESARQFREANRLDLAEQEEAEITVIQRFLPAALSETEMKALVDRLVADSGLPRTMASMRALMDLVRPQLEGRADLGQVGQYLRSLLT
mgnify:CR=1 FL=1